MDIQPIIERLRNDDDYYGEFGKQFISNSDIKVLITEPDLFKKPQHETIDMLKGKYFHTAVLEPHKLDSNFPIVECSNRNTKVYKEFREANGGGNFLLSKEKDDLGYLQQALYHKDDIYNIIKNAEAVEEPTIGQIEGIWFKAKADILNKSVGFVDDIKTTSNINDFNYSVKKYYYDSSAYIYRELFDCEMRFIVVDKVTKRIGMYYVSDSTYDSGRERVLRGLEEYHKYYGDNPTHDPSQYYHIGEV